MDKKTKLIFKAILQSLLFREKIKNKIMILFQTLTKTKVFTIVTL